MKVSKRKSNQKTGNSHKYFMQLALVVCCFFLLAANQADNKEHLFSIEKATGQKLSCPEIERTIADPIPGGFNWGDILNEGDGSFSSACVYFVKTDDNDWTSVVSIYVYWIVEKEEKEFDCKWEDQTDTRRYTTSKTRQAYVKTYSCDPQFSHHMPVVRKNLLRQVEALAVPCEEE